jgi:hypothetical protein
MKKKKFWQWWTIILVVCIIIFALFLIFQAAPTKYKCVANGAFPYVFKFKTFQEFNAFYEKYEKKIECSVNGRYTHKVCFYDNNNTPCGKTTYCPSHITEENCLAMEGTWEFETLEREMQAYPNLAVECQKIGGCR